MDAQPRGQLALRLTVPTNDTSRLRTQRTSSWRATCSPRCLSAVQPVAESP
jgi:hypothetical protein